jgi:hypothetical protein
MTRMIRIEPDQKVGLKLTPATRELLLGLILMDDEIGKQIRQAPPGDLQMGFTYDDLNSLVIYADAEVHTTKDDSYRKKLMVLSARIDRLIDRYTLM